MKNLYLLLLSVLLPLHTYAHSMETYRGMFLTTIYDTILDSWFTYRPTITFSPDNKYAIVTVAMSPSVTFESVEIPLSCPETFKIFYLSPRQPIDNSYGVHIYNVQMSDDGIYGKKYISNKGVTIVKDGKKYDINGTQKDKR